MRRLLLPLLLALVAGCSLPLPKDVQSVGEVPAERRQSNDLQVIPPGPKDDASPVGVVLGFLGAQASSDNDHGIARQFLTTARRAGWRDEAEVEVYDPGKLVVTALPGATAQHATVRVSFVVLGSVRTDGSYSSRGPEHLTEDYGLDRVAGQWRIAQVPDGLRLTVADRSRSFESSSVYYLVPGSETPHVIPDEVFLPIGSDLVTSLVARLFRPPSVALAGLVETAVPTSARLRGAVVVSGSGIATVDITGVRRLPDERGAQDLSAQLAWTLRSLGPSLRGLRLLVDGRVLPVPGQGAVQDLAAWDAYDPDGIGRTVPYYYVTGRRLRSSADLAPGPLTSGAAGKDAGILVDAVAVSPDRTQVGVITHERTGDVLRVGSLAASPPVATRGAELRSLSWGSGRFGLWLLRGSRDVLRATERGVVPVSVVSLPPGRIASFAVSRDGVRVAAVVGERLYVGRAEPRGTAVRVAGFNQVLPALHKVRKVAWASSGELVVLGSLTQTQQVVRVGVDGSFSSVVDTSGLLPSDLAASVSGIALVSSGRLYASVAGAFRQVGTGLSTAPAFPG